MASGSESPVLVDDQDSVRVLTLNRPGRANAWGADMAEALCIELLRAQTDNAVRACVLTGAGDRFSSGADLGAQPDPNTRLDTGLRAIHDGANPTFAALLAFEKPIVAAVRGYAIGAGFLVALCCDVILGSPTAQFALPQVSLGLLPAYGGLPRLAQWVGRGRALEIGLLGRRVAAEEAHAIGILASISEEQSLIADATSIARRLGAMPPLAVKLAKESLTLALESGSVRVSASADLYRFLCLQGTSETQEAQATWRERRASESRSGSDR